MTQRSYQSEFYVTGGTLNPNAPCYMVREADQELYAALQRGEFCSVLTSRQMGKSSLMQRTANRLRSDGVTVLTLDLTKIGSSLTVEQWYFGLLRWSGRQIGLPVELEEYWEANASLGPLQRFFGALTEVLLYHLNGPIVLFFDEIDTVRGLPFCTDDFFAAIRACYGGRAEDPDLRRLTFCLLGVASAADLIRDVRTTPFNIGRRIELADFTPEEAAPLAAGLPIGARIAYFKRRAPKAILSRVLHWTGGHPYLTQRLCQALAERASRNSTITLTTIDVDRACAELFFGARARQAETNLAFVSNILLHSDLNVVEVLGLYARVRRGKPVIDDVTSDLITLLHLSGICRARAGVLMVRNRIYSRVFDLTWIESAMPGAELTRQRAAYRSGLLRAALGSSGVVLVLALTTAYALRQRREAIGSAAASEHHARAEIVSAALAQKNAESANKLRAVEQAKESQLLAALSAAAAAKSTAQTAQTLAQSRAESERRYLLQAERQLSETQSDRGQTLLEKGGAHGLFDLIDSCASAREFPDLREAQGRVWRAWYSGYADRLLAVLTHEKEISAFAFSADGTLLATGSSDNTIQLWDTAKGMPHGKPLLHSGKVMRLAFHPAGTTLVSMTADRELYLWSVASGKQIYHRVEGTDERYSINDVAFSPNGRWLVNTWSSAFYGGEVCVNDPLTGNLLQRCGIPWASRLVFSPDSQRLLIYIGESKRDSKIGLFELAQMVSNRVPDGQFFALNDAGKFGTAAFSPNGRTIYAPDTQQNLSILEARDKMRLIETLHQNSQVADVAVRPDGKVLAIACWNGEVRLFDSETRKEVVSPLKHPGGVWHVAFSPDGRILAAAINNAVYLWNAFTWKSMGPPLLHTGGVAELVFHPEGRILATLCENSVRLWDVSDSKEVRFLPHLSVVRTAKFNPASTLIVTTSRDHAAQMWDANTGTRVLAPMKHGNEVAEAFFTIDGARIITRAEDWYVRAWDLSGKLLWSTPRQTEPIHALYLSPDGSRVVTAIGNTETGCTVQQWDSRTGRAVAPPRHQVELAYDMDYSPNGRLLAVEAGRDVHLLDAGTMKETGIVLHHRENVRSVAFSPNGKCLLSASDDHTARLWNSATGHATGLPLQHRGGVDRALFSPDGRYIATASVDGTVRLWSGETGTPVGAQLEQFAAIGPIAFSQDGKTLATSSQDQIQLWDVPSGHRLGWPYAQGSRITDISFSPNGRQLLVVMDTRMPQLIRLPNGPLPDIPTMRAKTEVALAIRRDTDGRERMLSWQEWRGVRDGLREKEARLTLPRYLTKGPATTRINSKL